MRNDNFISLVFFQGCMNNITFGNDKVGYYETVAGGAGAVSICENNTMDLI